ncbi:signal peptidase I [Qipengyuania sp. CAU 1752]
MVGNPETAADTSAQDKASQGPDENTPEQGRKGLSFPVFVLLVVLASLTFRSFAFSLYNIPSESMLPRLMNGDYLVASKWDFGFSRHSLPVDVPAISGRMLADTPERGDVVIFKHPVDGSDYIKRVIGLPGDIVEIRAGRVILNGEILPKAAMADLLVPVSANTDCPPTIRIERSANGAARCRYSRYRETLPSGRSYAVTDLGPSPQDQWGPKAVPEGKLFLLGDNRDNSQDSRFAPRSGGGIGFVPQELMVGKARAIIFSTDGSSQWLKPWTWVTAARGGRMGKAI